MQTNRKLITVFVLAIVAFMVAGSAASANAATIQKLPTCMDPTGNNLPCMMIISTLPAPPNALQCEETSGQILSCSYATQFLSNGEQVAVITVYVPANFVFSSPAVIKVIVHETTTTSTTGGGTGGSKTLLVVIGISKDPIVRGNIQTITVTVADSKKASMRVAGADVNGKVTYLTGHPEPLNGVTDEQGIYSHQWRISGDAIPGKFKVDAQASADGKLGSAKTTFTVIPKTNTTIVPINLTKGNMTVAASGGKVTGPTCVDNCTTGTTPLVDCKTNPRDPSCTQSLTPSTTTPPLTSVPPSTSPTTKTCPDGSVIDANANCPTQSTPPSTPNTPSTPPSTPNTPSIPPSTSGTPPPSNNPPPSGSNNGGGGSSSGGGGSGSGSGGGSGPSQATTVS